MLAALSPMMFHRDQGKEGMNYNFTALDVEQVPLRRQGDRIC